MLHKIELHVCLYGALFSVVIKVWIKRCSTGHVNSFCAHTGLLWDNILVQCQQMHWLLVSPWHQHPCYQRCCINRTMFFTGKDSITNGISVLYTRFYQRSIDLTQIQEQGRMAIKEMSENWNPELRQLSDSNHISNWCTEYSEPLMFGRCYERSISHLGFNGDR